MRICELREKEVINCRNGQRLGFVCDVDFDICSAKVHSLIIPGPCKIWGILGRESEYIIDYCCVKQIGEDVILVDIDEEKALVKCKF
jgi:YlmC/YmxH family sporulation protein